MSYATARSIALRIQGGGEFSKQAHPAPSAVPCGVAGFVANAAASQWELESGNHFSVGVTASGYDPGPYLGLFVCSGKPTHIGGVRLSCVHRADRHAGAIVMRGLAIIPVPRA